MATFEALALGGSLVMKTASQLTAASAQKRALDIRSQQEQIASDQRELQRAQQLQQVISTQNANQAASGVSMASPSFNAIQQDSFNQAAQDEQLEALNNQFQQTAIQVQKQNITDNEWLSVGSNLFDAAKDIYNKRIPGSSIEDDDYGF
jgi:5,10-methylene-tetrahydrofolate dehydrogenase/methenyl tetrahydrofolate cyclohydrolase